MHWCQNNTPWHFNAHSIKFEYTTHKLYYVLVKKLKSFMSLNKIILLPPGFKRNKSIKNTYSAGHINTALIVIGFFKRISLPNNTGTLDKNVEVVKKSNFQVFVAVLVVGIRPMYKKFQIVHMIWHLINWTFIYLQVTHLQDIFRNCVCVCMFCSFVPLKQTPLLIESNFNCRHFNYNLWNWFLLK